MPPIQGAVTPFRDGTQHMIHVPVTQGALIQSNELVTQQGDQDPPPIVVHVGTSLKCQRSPSVTVLPALKDHAERVDVDPLLGHADSRAPASVQISDVIVDATHCHLPERYNISRLHDTSPC